MIVSFLLLVTSLCMTVISGYVSIVGLTSIFSAPSSYYVIIAIASSLDVAKVLVTLWLHAHWNITNIFLKTYLITLVTVLILLNATSSFGFMSKSHIEQTLNINGASADQVRVIDTKIENETVQIDDLTKQITQIDDAVNKLTQTGKGNTTLVAIAQQRKTRDSLESKKEEHVKNISNFNEQKIELQSNIRKLEAEVGPIKYIAQMVYGSADNDQLEKAVRILTSIIVLIFDPLAIVLLIASNIGLGIKKNLTLPPKHSILKVDDKIFGD